MLAERLQFTMNDLGYRFPPYPVPPGETESSFLRKITEVGARDRYRPYHDKARAQIARELDLIEKLELAGYFLIVWDIVNFCRQQDILVQGRGSAANSAVCYSLGITAVDPVGMELLFERFLSEERGEWPDIDLDLPSGDRRERVIQHVYEKYGTHGAGMTANVITYRGRSAAREVGKALGLDPGLVDRLAKVMNQFEFIDPADTIGRNMTAAGLDAGHRRVQHFARLWYQMQDLPRHLGQHSGGMVICQSDLSSVVPLENASMPGRVVVQWDKDDCADMGLIKVDLLGLGMMAVLQDAIRLVNESGVRSAKSEVRVGATCEVGEVRSAVESKSEVLMRTDVRTDSVAPEALDFADSAPTSHSAPHLALRTSTPHSPMSSTSPTSRKTIPPSTRCSAPRTRLGCFRSSRGRRWRPCRGSSRRASTISSFRSPSSAPAPSSGRWCIRISIAAPGGRR